MKYSKYSKQFNDDQEPRVEEPEVVEAVETVSDGTVNDAPESAIFSTEEDTPAMTASVTTLKVNTRKLNLRSLPTTKSEVLEVLEKGDILDTTDVITSGTIWIEATKGNVTGHIMTEFVDVV